MTQPITSVVLSVTSHRCHYLGRSPDTGHLEHQRWPVLGWAAQGPVLYPVRVEEVTGRGVLCGSEADPMREGFLGVLTAGAALAELGDDVDEHVRQMIRDDLEVRDAEADED